MAGMFRISGCGTGFAGVSKPDREGNCTATKWFMMFFLPVFPIARYTVKPLSRVRFRFQYKIISRHELAVREVLKTYLFGWIVFPLLIFGPFLTLSALGTPEAEQALGLPEWTQVPFISLGILWLVVTVWKLRTWEFSRWFRR